jgi:hypothetical protein
MDKHFLSERSPDILIRRDTFPPDADHDTPYSWVRANVPRTVVCHSPSGFEFGYGGSGAADLALNILQAFLPGREIKCQEGTKCSREAFLLHQPFKEDFLASSTSDRIRIETPTIKAWIAEQLPKRRQALGVALEAIPAAPEPPVVPSLVANHPAASALFYLVREARKETETTDLEVVEGFLAKFPGVNLTGLETAKTLEDTVEDLQVLTRITGDVLSLLGHRSESRPAKPDPRRAMILLGSLDHLLDQLEVKLGMVNPADAAT